MGNFTVSIVILATDESSSLIKTVDFIMNDCKNKIDCIVVVLSRYATDSCVEACKFIKTKYGKTVEISVQEKDGLGCAIRHGINCVKTSHMIFFPADLAIELESIDRMISLGQKSPDIIVKTSRWIEDGQFVSYNKSRLFFNCFAQIFLRFLFSCKLTDLTNPVQLIPFDYENKIKWKEDGFSALLEQTIVPVRLGYSVKEVPAKCLPRLEGKSKNSFFKTAGYLKTAIRIRLTSKNKFYK